MKPPYPVFADFGIEVITGHQAQGVGDDALEFLAEGGELGGLVLLSGVAQLAQQVNDALLLFAGQLVVCAEEVGHNNAAEIFSEFLDCDVARPAGNDFVQTEPVGDESPHPVVSPADAPAGLVHVDRGAAADGFPEGGHFGRQPARDALCSEGQRAGRDAQAAKVFQQPGSFLERQTEGLLEHDAPRDGHRADAGVGNFSFRRGRFHQFVAAGTPVAIPDEPCHFLFRGNNVFLRVLPRIGWIPKGRTAVGTCYEAQPDGLVCIGWLVSCATLVSLLPTGFLLSALLARLHKRWRVGFSGRFLLGKLLFEFFDAIAELNHQIFEETDTFFKFFVSGFSCVVAAHKNSLSHIGTYV